MTLVKEGRGRRLFPAAPDSSLLLLEGDRRRRPRRRQEDGGRLRRVQARPPLDRRRHAVRQAETTRPSRKISVYPEHRVLTRQSKQQFAVYAHYSRRHGRGRHPAGPVREQRPARSPSSTATGLVRTLAHERRGGGHGPLPGPRRRLPRHRAARREDARLRSSPQQTVVDQHTREEVAGARHRAVASCARDEQFIRRVYARHHRHAADAEAGRRRSSPTRTPTKRDKLDRPAARDAGVRYFFANKWADILRVKRRQPAGPGRRARSRSTPGSARRSPRTSRTTSSSARSSARPATRRKNPPTVWYKELQTARAVRRRRGPGLPRPAAGLRPVPPPSVREVEPGRLLGPGRVLRPRRPQERCRSPGGDQQPAEPAAGDLHHGRPAPSRTSGPSKPADDEAARRRPDGRRRRTTTRGRSWSTGWPTPKNPFFARAVANRYWAHFFGRGIVDPLDDMRVTNPPSNPELLDALAKDLVDNKYSLKRLVKTICKSRTYQLARDAERVQQARQAGVRPLLPEAAGGRGAVRRGLPGDGQPDARSAACRRTSTRRTGRSCCRTSRSRRTSWTCSAGRSGSAPASASASARRTWPRRCTC